jgi:hypothetical protein
VLWFKSISTSALASFGQAWPPSAKNFLNPRILPQRSLDQAGGAVAISDICRDYLDREEVTFGIDEGVALNGFNFLTRIACRPTAKHRVQGPAEKTSTYCSSANHPSVGCTQTVDGVAPGLQPMPHGSFFRFGSNTDESARLIRPRSLVSWFRGSGRSQRRRPNRRPLRPHAAFLLPRA